MEKVTILLIGIGIAAILTISLIVIPTTNPDTKVWLSVTAETSPNGVKIYSVEQLSSLDESTTILDNATLDQNPVLKNAINQAFSDFSPPSCEGHYYCQVSHTFTTQISQNEANIITRLADNKVNQWPLTENNDTNLGIDYVTYTSDMEFKFDNFYYHVFLQKSIPSSNVQLDNNS